MSLGRSNYTVYFSECCMCFVKKKTNKVWFTSTSWSWLSGFQIHSVSLLFSCLVVLLIIKRNVLTVPMMFVYCRFVLWCFQLLLHEVWDFISCTHTCDCYLFKIDCQFNLYIIFHFFSYNAPCLGVWFIWYEHS